MSNRYPFFFRYSLSRLPYNGLAYLASLLCLISSFPVLMHLILEVLGLVFCFFTLSFSMFFWLNSWLFLGKFLNNSFLFIKFHINFTLSQIVFSYPIQLNKN